MSEISAATFSALLATLGEQGADDVVWAESLKEPIDAGDFALETIFVICNSGMKNTIARKIYERIVPQITAGGSAFEVFKHKGKASAIDKIWMERDRFYAEYMAAPDKVAYAITIPWIGGITCYHLVKNFGADVAKPDVHLQRLADREGVTAQALCERLARETGYRVATVDTILWRACANGLVNSKTGEMAPPSPIGGEQP